MAEDNENLEELEDEEVSQTLIGEETVEEIDKIIDEAENITLETKDDNEKLAETESEQVESKEETNKEEEPSGEKEEEVKERTVEEDYERYFNDIKADELLPEEGTEEDDSFQNKFKNITNLGKDTMKKSKITPTIVIVTLIVIIGSIVMYLNIREPEVSRKDNYVYQLPTMSINVQSEDGMGHNIKLTIGLSINSKYATDVNLEECYNIAYDAVCGMTFEEFDTENAQFNIKRTVEDAFMSNVDNPLPVKVYVSGLDIGKASMEGYVPGN